MYDRQVSIQEVLDVYEKNHKICNKQYVRSAYEFAATKHYGVKRGTGEPYINHPLRVARLIAEWGFESDVIAAALLHDVVEDSDTKLNEIQERFGVNAARVVDAVTALSDRDFAGHALTKAQRDLLSDARLQQKMNDKALYVKIADRIDNLNTLDGVPEAKRIPKAEHTREIIIPMAMLEHAYELVDELEEMCFRIEHPAMYDAIKNRYQELCEINWRTCEASLAYLAEVFDPRSHLDPEGAEQYSRYLKGLVQRPKSCVSIYRQISQDADNIKDWEKFFVKERVPLYDLTVLVKDGMPQENIHGGPSDLFFHYFEAYLAPKGFYLCMPQYTAHGEDICFLLADEMDNQYRLFVKTEREYQRYLYGDIIDSETGLAIEDINEIDPRETYNEKIKVFRKDGSAMRIDRDATVLDFAFQIHSDLGYHFHYAMIDDSRTQLPAYTRVNQGDRITIVADETISPSITWFRYTKTSKATQYLVGYFQDLLNSLQDQNGNLQQ